MSTIAMPFETIARPVSLNPAAAADSRWEAVVERNPRFDGVLFYGVRTTGVYCRPSCPARRPRRENVRFFFAPAAAERAGFRACKRCRPGAASSADSSLERVRRVCRYIERNLEASLTLRELGSAAGLSPFHLQRVFKRITGITPRQYVEARRLERFRVSLRLNDRDVTTATYEAGYGSSSRIYEKTAAQLGMTPATYRKGAPSVRIRYAIAECSLGRILVGATEKGISSVKVGSSPADLERELRAEFPRASLERDPDAVQKWVAGILERAEGRAPARDLPLDIRATAFQRRVFDELLRIPSGSTRSYSEVARSLGMPAATRAVARACATNPVALIIPCHRVVRADGKLAGYRWGLKRKRQLLDREASHAARSRG